ncbi:MBL fold metallo-hydrolase [Peribacillus acanthi]|uniref:MBL fold metallo-hydrolase n=1 Tax=Peribacillus acanthi TaxID=2171554 RepID=UPI000D3EA48D|nr:MBL fold metallo-hydrolase [Peribacillus acanthi]
MHILMILIVFLIAIYGLMSSYTPLGRRSSKEKIQSFEQSINFSKGKFINQIPTSMEMKFSTSLGLLRDFIKGNPKGKPDAPIPMEKLVIQSPLNGTKITWFGHSALLIEIDGKNILIDPMFGKAPTPFPFFGDKRYSKGLPFDVEELPRIDAVLLSHDHYDHLDYYSIKKLKRKVEQFFVPLGVGSHLKRWGVAPEKIHEHDWWKESKFGGLTFACTPARHFSGRSLNDRNSTLWCSWVIVGMQDRMFFSGDSGYGPHFKEIGEKYGPFDVTMMECGQYDQRWSAIHMLPEETVQAHLDVKGKVLIPIHWAAFTLALHDWTDPIERVLSAANEKGIIISTPKIGETVILASNKYPSATWWR